MAYYAITSSYTGLRKANAYYYFIVANVCTEVEIAGETQAYT